MGNQIIIRSPDNHTRVTGRGLVIPAMVDKALEVPQPCPTETRNYACRLTVAAICAVNNLTVNMLQSPGRSSLKITFARQIAMYLAHTKFGIPYSDVGKFFRKDRSTVAHACMVIEDKREDAGFDDHLIRLEYLFDAAMPETPEIQRLLISRNVGGLA